MKRRDFVTTAAAAVGGELLASIAAQAQTVTLQPIRTTQLVPLAGRSNVVRFQNIIFDGQRFLALYQTSSAAQPPQFSISATSQTGGFLWNYPLPAGMHFSLGTYSGMILSIAARYAPPSGVPVRFPVWLMDPSTGEAAISGHADNNGTLLFAGDSMFFRAAAGLGEVWTFNGGLEMVASGIAANAFATPFQLQGLVGPGTMAVATMDGQWLARVSMSSGQIQECPLSSSFMTGVRAYYASLRAAMLQNIDTSKARLAEFSIVLALGGQSGQVYALVASPTDSGGVSPIVQFDEVGGSAVIGKLQIPRTAPGAPMPTKLVAVGSEIGVVCTNGVVAWYSLPNAA